MLERTTKEIFIVSTEIFPEIMNKLGQVAFEKRSAKFHFTSDWPNTYYEYIQQMKQIGNSFMRQVTVDTNIIAILLDDKEVLISPEQSLTDIRTAIYSNTREYCKIYEKMIKPFFQKKSKPI